MPMEYIVPSLRVVALTEMTDVDAFEERLLQLIHLEDECFIERKNVWHNKHIKNK